MIEIVVDGLPVEVSEDTEQVREDVRKMRRLMQLPIDHEPGKSYDELIAEYEGGGTDGQVE